VQFIPVAEESTLILDIGHMPDEALMQALESMRGHGRDDYPIRPMWNAVVAGVVFQHQSIESLRREMGRNPALLQCCGFEALPVSPNSGWSIPMRHQRNRVPRQADIWVSPRRRHSRAFSAT
jgi:hypothetical protein